MWLEDLTLYTPETEPSFDDIGQLIWVLRDQDSIDDHRQREMPLVAQEISPLTASDEDRQIAAIALWEKASAHLLWEHHAHQHYNVVLDGPLPIKSDGTQVLPGDRVRLTYKGEVRTVTGYFKYLDVNELFYIVERTRVEEGGKEHDELVLADLIGFLTHGNEEAIGCLFEEIQKLQMRGT